MADFIFDTEAFIQKNLSFSDASGGDSEGFLVQLFDYAADTLEPDPSNPFYFHHSVTEYKILKSRFFMDQWGGLAKLPVLYHHAMVSGEGAGGSTKLEHVDAPLYYRAHLYHGVDANSLSPFPDVAKPQGAPYDGTFSINNFFFHYPSGIVDGAASSQAHVVAKTDTSAENPQKFTDYRNIIHNPVEMSNITLPVDHKIYMALTVNDNEATVQDYMLSAFNALHPTFSSNMEVQLVASHSTAGMQRTIELTNEEVGRQGTGSNVHPKSPFCVFSLSYLPAWGGRTQAINGTITLGSSESSNSKVLKPNQKLPLYQNQEWHHTIDQDFGEGMERVRGGKGRLALSQVTIYPFTDSDSAENVFDLIREFPVEDSWSPQKLKFSLQTSAFGDQGVVISSILASTMPPIIFNKLESYDPITLDPQLEKNLDGNLEYQGDILSLVFRETDLTGDQEMVIGYSFVGTFYKDLPGDIYKAGQWWRWDNHPQSGGFYSPIPKGLHGSANKAAATENELNFHYGEDVSDFDLEDLSLSGTNGGY